MIQCICNCCPLVTNCNDLLVVSLYDIACAPLFAYILIGQYNSTIHVGSLHSSQQFIFGIGRGDQMTVARINQCMVRCTFVS